MAIVEMVMVMLTVMMAVVTMFANECQLVEHFWQSETTCCSFCTDISLHCSIFMAILHRGRIMKMSQKIPGNINYMVKFISHGYMHMLFEKLEELPFSMPS